MVNKNIFNRVISCSVICDEYKYMLVIHRKNGPSYMRHFTNSTYINHYNDYNNTNTKLIKILKMLVFMFAAFDLSLYKTQNNVLKCDSSSKLH